MDETTLKIESNDGHRFEMIVTKNSNASSTPLVLCLPAMGVSARHYRKLLSTLAESGYIAAVIDYRGLGSSSIRASRKHDFSYGTLVEQDVQASVTKLLEMFPENDFYLLGHSLGGQLATMYLGLNNFPVKGLILVASGSVFNKNWDFPKNVGILLGTQIAGLVAKFIGYFPGKRLGFAGSEARSVIRDWAHLARTGRFEPKESIFNYEEAFPQVKLPILGIAFEGDWLAPYKSLKGLCQKLVSADVNCMLLRNDKIPKETLDHFGWVQHSKPVLMKINSWIKSLQ